MVRLSACYLRLSEETLARVLALRACKKNFFSRFAGVIYIYIKL